MNDPASRVVSVEIHGNRYPVRSSLDPGYVSALASYVDDKMNAAAEETPSGDSLKVAVLAAINIADEFFRCRAERSRQMEILDRAEALEELIDRALESSRL